MTHNATTLLAAADALPSADQDRLARILDDYLVAIERGAPVSPDELLARHPEYADHLRGYLSGLRLIHAAGEPLAADGTALRSAWNWPCETIGDFHLIREIGRGGMGIVYEAWQAALKRRVALKVLPFTAMHDAKHTARFKNEAQAAAQVQHPNIVPVFAVGEHRGVHYYAMQLISGKSLTTLLEEQRGESPPSEPTTRGNGSRTVCDVASANATPLKFSRSCAARAAELALRMSAAESAQHICSVARIGVQAAEALHAAHEYGVVHRDVKPSNLLLDEHGKLWVTDFGLARCRENDCLTQSGDILGTMRYMSPEQALGRTTMIDHRTDIYSLGVTLYELAARNHPADVAGTSPWYIERGRPNFKPLRHWNRHIPVDFQTILMKAISEFPHERYETAQAMAEDLQRFSDGRPILASPPTLLTRSRKWAVRHRQAIAIAAVVAFVGMCVHTLLLTREQAAKQRALESAQTSRQEAHAVLDRFGAKLVDQLAAVPGAEGVRQQLLQDTLDLYQRFADYADDDANLHNDLALAYGKAGGLAEKIGDDSLAIEHYRNACGEWQKRIAGDPGSVELQRNLSVCKSNLAMLLCRTGPAEESVALLQEAYDVQKNLQAAAPDVSQLAIDLATTQNNLGMLLQSGGQLDDATQYFQAAVAMLEQLASSTTVEEPVLRGLAASYNNLSSALAVSEFKQAIETYEKAIAIQRRLVRGSPNNLVYQAELAQTYNNVGYLHSRQQKWADAERSYLQAIRLQESLVKAAPSAVAYCRALAVSHNNLGMAQCQNDHLLQSEMSFRAAVKLQEGLLATQPADVQALSHQGSVYNNLGQLFDSQKRLSDAEAAYQQAVHHQKRAIELVSDSRRFRALLNRHYLNYAANLRSQKRFGTALQVVLERSNLWRGQPIGMQSVATELAKTCRSMHGGDAAVALEPYTIAAVEALREAVAFGMPPEQLHDSAYAAIAGTEPFRRLLVDLADHSTVTPAVYHGSEEFTLQGNKQSVQRLRQQSQGANHHGQTN